MLALSAACAWGGWHFGQRQETRREPGGREALGAFEGELRRELDRLAHLYESHLRRITASADRGVPWLRLEARRIVGIQQLSLLTTHGDSSRDSDLEITRGEVSAPRPFIEGRPRQLATVQLPTLQASDAPDAVWVDEPGKPLIFCRKADDLMIAAFINPDTVAAAISIWLREQKSDGIRELPVQAWTFEGPANRTVAKSDNRSPDRIPDVLLPMHTRFGTWRVQAWDRETRHQVWHTPTLVAGWGGAMICALMGIGLFAQQQQALRCAEQRVSFVNQVSHELRSPITNIRLNTDLALDLLDGAEPEAAQRLALVSDETARLGRLVENVLTFSRSERGMLQLQPRMCVPAEVLRTGVLAPFARALERRGVKVTAELDPASATLDLDALTQIVANLVSNVEKYSASGGILNLSSEVTDNWLIVRVADRGPGIPATMREVIFEPFRRLDSRTAEGASGAGLGLSIARDLAVRMGGTLQLVPSEEGSGACFELRVPRGYGFAVACIEHTDKLSLPL